MTRTQDTILFFLCLSFIVIVVGLGYWRMFPTNPADFDPSQVRIITPSVQAGGDLIIRFPVTKYGYYPVEISSTLINCDKPLVYALPPDSGSLPPGKYILDIEIKIPQRVDPGRYKLTRMYAYTVNPASIVIKYFETPCFMIKAAENKIH